MRLNSLTTSHPTLSLKQVPVYYVLFTLSTIVGSNILYRDFENEDPHTIFLFGTGCALTFYGVWLLTSRRQRGDKSTRSTPLLPSKNGPDWTPAERAAYIAAASSAAVAKKPAKKVARPGEKKLPSAHKKDGSSSISLSTARTGEQPKKRRYGADRTGETSSDDDENEDMKGCTFGKRK